MTHLLRLIVLASLLLATVGITARQAAAHAPGESVSVGHCPDQQGPEVPSPTLKDCSMACSALLVEQAVLCPASTAGTARSTAAPALFEDLDPEIAPPPPKHS
jgi:hypothetical protein